MSLASVVRGSSLHTLMPYMDSNLDILNAVQYDIGVPLPSMRATRGTKRRRLSVSRDADKPKNTEKDNSYSSRPRTNASDTAVNDLLSSVDVAPSRRQEDVDMDAPATKAKTGRKPTKKTAGKAAASSSSTIMQSVEAPDSDEADDDGDGAEGDKKRARGRPRIDVKDVTAADRRRTQIRLAQRAYRSRKEKAIVSLEKRVNSLREANEAMSNAFMSLHDFAVGRGLLDQHPDLAQQLRQTTEVFLEMARQSSADEDMDDHDDEDGHGQGECPNSGVTADDAAKEFQQKQKAINDAVKTFGYQTEAQQEALGKQRPSIVSEPGAPDVISQQIMMPPQPSAVRPSNPLQDHLYGGIVMHQPMNIDGSSNSATFDQQTASLFDSSFGMAMNIVNSVTGSPSGGAPVGSFYSATASGSGVAGTGTATTNTDSGTNSALSVSPSSGRNLDFTLGNQFPLDGVSFSLFSNYPSPSGQDVAAPTSTSDLGPHLADTDAFIASAAMGSPYAGLAPPTNYPPDISFGLRLRRYAIESAYRLINSSDPPADAFARAFGFCIMFEPVEQIRARLLKGLETPFNTSKFTRWELPFVSRNPDIADAPQSSVASPSARSTASSSTSSRKIPNNSNSDHRGTSVRPAAPRIHVTLPGFEGAFYDCEETEMYLQQRGVHIPPNSESVIVEVDDADFALGEASAAASTTTGSTARTTNTSATSTSTRSGASASGIGSWDYLSPDLITPKTSRNAGSMDWTAGGIAGTIAAAARGGGNSPNNNISNDFMSFMDNAMFNFSTTTPIPNAAFPQRRLLSLDVDKFLKELVRRGTCLGQTPGFRASDVNEAFWLAARNASSA